MKLPKFSLTSSRKGRNSGLSGESVILQGEVFKSNFNIFWIFLEHLLEYGHQPGTVLSFKIIKNGDYHRRISRSLERRTGCIDLLDKVKDNHLNGFVLAAA